MICKCFLCFCGLHFYLVDSIFWCTKFKIFSWGNSMAGQWLGLHALAAEGQGPVPSQGTKIPQSHVAWPKKKFLLIFMKSSLLVFFLFLPLPFGFLSRKHFQIQCHEGVIPCFILRVLLSQVSHLGPWSVLSWFLHVVWVRVQLYSACDSQHPSTVSWTIFPIDLGTFGKK